MKEIQEILKKINELQPGEKAILATVVDVKGSSYRLPGAKMLILENGDTFGTVSGGCLEADILERAKQVLATGEPQIFVYDTTNDLDSVFSLNMGCRGVIRILLEPIEDNKLFDFIADHFREKSGLAVATLIDSKNALPIGSRMFFDETGVLSSEFDLKKDEYSAEIATETRRHFADRRSEIVTLEIGEVFIEYISPPINLTIFGAGADAIPLSVIAKDLGWQVSVVDHRTAFANKERFSKADEFVIFRSEDIKDNLTIGENLVAVVMTHNYEHDKNILKFLLKSDAKYVGALGPKRRTENILSEFEESGVKFSEKELQNLYAPVGLDIGGDTPEAIALSIVAEIQAVLKERTGGFLRERKGSIYGRDK